MIHMNNICKENFSSHYLLVYRALYDDGLLVGLVLHWSRTPVIMKEVVRKSHKEKEKRGLQTVFSLKM